MDTRDEGLAFLLRYENVAWYESGTVRILDRRIYPVRIEFVTCHTHGEVAQAIADMVTQSGGPYTAAAMGMALAAWEARDKNAEDALAFLEQAAYTLAHARPTTAAKMERVTAHALERAKTALAEGVHGEALADLLRQSAIDQLNVSYAEHDRMAEYLADLTPRNATVMTQCFAESIIGCYLRECRRRNNEVKLICPETRPYFQGARLTASVAQDMDFDVTVITDNMPGYTMREKKVDLFTSASDVITMDGHIINKVGTFQIALCASYWGIPYYVTGTPDPKRPNLDSVTIEERDPALVLDAMGTRTALPGVKGFYPAFDITPPKLCDGVVTNKGVFAPCNLKHYFD